MNFGRAKEGISIQRDGFSIVVGADVYRLPWREIVRIEAFKRDLVVVDIICLEFSLAEGSLVFEINEELPGYRNLLAEIERVLKVQESTWYEKVVQQPMKESRTLVYKRA